MGSEDTGLLFHQSGVKGFHQLRSRFSRFLLFKRLDYVQWICTVAVFLFFVALFQMFLPGSVIEENGLDGVGDGDSEVFREIRELDFGESVEEFHHWKVLEKYRDKADVSAGDGSSLNATKKRFGYRKPQLALVFPDLLVDPQQILMVTVAASLLEIGYSIQVFSLEEGPMRTVWGRIGVPLNIIQTGDRGEIAVDWLNYDGILVNSLEVRGLLLSCFMKEPFRSVPLIWTVHEGTLATRLRQYNSSGQVELLNDWKRIFERASVIVYPNYFLPMTYSILDSSNFFVIPGSPFEIWQANNMMTHPIKNLRSRMGYGDSDFVIAIVGSQFLYRGLWLEHALVLRALHSVLENSSNSISSDYLKVIVLGGNSNSNYTLALKTIALSLGYTEGIVRHIPIDGDAESALGASDLVIYGSFLEEQAFPDILVKAMSLGKPIVAPDLHIIRKYVSDKVNGYLFPKEDIKVLSQIVIEVCSIGKLSAQASQVASVGKQAARNLTVSGVVEGYASLVGNVVQLPSEAALPKAVADIPPQLKETWQWNLFEAFDESLYVNRTSRSLDLLDKVEQNYNISREAPAESGIFVYNIWEGERKIQMAALKKKREDDELKDRTDQIRGTWEDVYRNAKKVDRLKNDLHEREDGELERTGQPLCVYEPYVGEGAWPFLHHKSLYRGIGLSIKGRRPRADDIDAPSRLPLLGNPYYMRTLGEYGAFFAIANRVDRIHKNAWIGFQSWRATARKANLSDIAERRLIHAIQNQKHGDALYFWANMDMEPRNPQQRDFWSFCDAVNAGNCRFAFAEAIAKVYNIKHHNFSSLPPMPLDGDTWSVMHSWALPTKSFLEFVMFSRMFVDALDQQMYNNHYKNGQCYLSLSRDKHCYSRILELLINVWAYHSARQMIYVDPVSGSFQEQHRLRTRRGQMWVKWFSYTTLKSMDEDLAEEYDTEHPSRRWLWPKTGEIFWQGIYEKERNQRLHEKETRKQQSKDKISRMRKKQRQKVIGKYVKPQPDVNSNSTSTLNLNSSATSTSNFRR